MKAAARLALALLLPASVGAWGGEPELQAAKPALRAPLDLAPARDSFGRPLGAPRQQTAVARAMDEAWKKGASEANLKAWSDVLVKCQQATNPAWTTALVRSEPQQAHCYRY
ncbi:MULTISPECIES: hypothetical protein [unclassified Duganella]|uniref:hypothetical protein n=1 Tax=unclassified Duganella TaxID=2636909 RepID=UPI0006F5F3E7|nr:MULTISPECIES: hypothetical protein [unclassified Duganella]KQV54203.1 hypothetical protein ASD07_06615 [Duganella sp. Root336D2]KRC03331.1 hypothetical protein ASE26_00340 [Duganella sp. Root198D2]